MIILFLLHRTHQYLFWGILCNEFLYYSMWVCICEWDFPLSTCTDMGLLHLRVWARSTLLRRPKLFPPEMCKSSCLFTCILTNAYCNQNDYFLRFYLFIFRQRGGEGERGREISICGCLLHAPYWGPGLQPRHVSWLGIELAILWFAGQRSICWATPARAIFSIMIDMK